MDPVAAAVMRGILLGLATSGAIDRKQLNEVYSRIEMEGGELGDAARQACFDFVTSVVQALGDDPR